MNTGKVVKIIFLILAIVGVVIIGNDHRQKLTNSSTKPSFPTENEAEATLSDSKPKLPEDFPQNFPVYSGAKLISSSRVLGQAGKGLSVVWEAEGNLDSISKFYERELTNNGWTLSSRLDGDNFLTFSIEKGETRGFVGITKEKENEVAVSVSLGVK